MAEEQACLVRMHSDSETSSKLGSFGSLSHTMAYTEDRLTAFNTSTGSEGAGEPESTVNVATSPPHDNPDNESGELLDYNDSSVLEQFHEDALRQAGCGLSQARVVLAGGLAVAGASLELAAIPFILPSAEIELCILRHEKNWLVLISLVGGSLGAVGWGVLAERLGRRRTLLSCLAVNAVFAAIAAFMPTYGTFMMARFCSAIGSGGIVPTCYTYAGEMTSRSCRQRALAWLLAAAGIGALLAAALASAVLPPNGALTLVENKEHFSAWHRYLLLCTLPILASLVSLIWTQESPRYLLDAGREVDAMMVYQNMHSGNQVRLCGSKANVAAAGNRSPSCHLGELSLPGKRRPPASHHVAHSVKMFWQAFFQLFSSTYRSTTLSLGGILLFTMAIQFYLASYIPSVIVRMENQAFEASKRTVQNVTFTNEQYNQTLENVEYKFTVFDNCTFRNMLMSHVAFRNCSFKGVALSNIKTSYTIFGGSTFFNSTIIDTDIEVGRELDEWCVLNNTVVLGMEGGCNRHADLTTRLGGLTSEQSYVAQAMVLVSLVALFPQRVRPTAALCGCLVFLSPALYFMQSETELYILEAVYRAPLTLIFFGVSIGVVDSYPANLRCTAHGLVLSVAYMGAAVVRGVGDGGPLVSSVLCTLFSIASTALALRMRMQAKRESFKTSSWYAALLYCCAGSGGVISEGWIPTCREYYHRGVLPPCPRGCAAHKVDV